MKLPRVIVYLGALAAIALVVLITGAWLLSRLIDSQMIRDKISSELAIKTRGSLSIGKITVLWLPWPSVVIENAEVAFGDHAWGAIPAVQIYPSFGHLLTGRWVMRQARLERAQWRIRLAQRAAEPFNLDELENEIRAALVALTRALPTVRVELTDGSAEINIGDQPPLVVENLAVQTVASPDELRFDLRARANRWEWLKITGRTSPQKLTFELDIGVQGLKIKESLRLLALPNLDYLQAGEVSLEMKAAGVGARKLKASVDGSAGPLVLARHGSKFSLEAKRIKAALTYEGGALQADLEQLELGAPRLQASGTLKILANSCAASVELRDGEIAQLGELAQYLTDDPESVKRVLRYVPGGTISEMKLHSAACSLAEMAARKNFDVAATLRNGKVVVPGPDLEFTNVATALRIAGDILEAKEVAAQLGAAKAWNGKLRLGLAGKTAPFHLDAEVQTSAPQLHAVLLKLVADERWREELNNVQKPEGELTGRLILGETLAKISPVVKVSKANLSAIYAPVALPIKIRGARLASDPSMIRVENAQGSIGSSSFAGLGVTWHHDGSRRVKVDARRVSLDLQQTDGALRSFQALRPYFTGFRSARGQLELDKLAFSGAYDAPAGWTWASTGSFTQVEIERADFPERISLARGKFVADQGRVVFSESAASLSDATFAGDARFEYARGTPIQMESRGSADIGAQMIQWLSRAVALPEDVKLRPPLTITAGRFAWRAGGDISFAGRVAAAGGAELAIEVTQRPQGLTVPILTIDDGGRRAQATLQLFEEQLEASFSGELTEQTLDKLFASFPMKGASLRGEINLSAALAAPNQFIARGQLSGGNLLLPLGREKVALEKFTIEAGGESVLIRSAELGWRNSRLSVGGKVGAGKEAWRLDLDVSGDRLDLAQLDRLFSGEDKQSKKATDAMSLPRVEGTLRLKLDSFSTERFTLSPLQVRTDLSSSLIKAEIERAHVCGINTTGRVEVMGRNIRLDLQLAAKDADLEPTTVCLTHQRSDIKGTYTLSARITGRGDRTSLRSALKGDYDFSALDGAFVRAAGVDAAFDYLNESGDFNVVFPDLDKQAIAYQMFSAKGTIDGEKILNEQIIVRASPYIITGQGSLELQSQQIDLKGLVSVALPANQVIKWIPIFGPIVGGSVVGIPLRINGSVERPKVTYLSPADLGAELLNLPLRILGTPLDAIRLFAPSGENRDTNITR
jgi:hypothetical protein